jgi:hypothetical protein
LILIKYQHSSLSRRRRIQIRADDGEWKRAEEYWIPKKMCFWAMNLSGSRGMGTPTDFSENNICVKKSKEIKGNFEGRKKK